jgi:hypothetical protein
VHDGFRYIPVIIIADAQGEAKAFPCVGDNVKEYCLGYHDGAIQARKDFTTGRDPDLHQRNCIHDTTMYCHGYNRGYNDEADFLG